MEVHSVGSKGDWLAFNPQPPRERPPATAYTHECLLTVSPMPVAEPPRGFSAYVCRTNCRVTSPKGASATVGALFLPKGIQELLHRERSIKRQEKASILTTALKRFNLVYRYLVLREERKRRRSTHNQAGARSAPQLSTWTLVTICGYTTRVWSPTCVG